MDNAFTTFSAAAGCFEPLAKPRHRVTGDLVAYWSGKCASRLMPARADIHPAEMRPHLPNLILLDSIDDGTDFHIRLFGSRLVEFFGAELTGRRVSAIEPSVVATKWLALARACQQSARPVFGHTRMAVDDRFHVAYEAALMPLSPDGRRITQILARVTFLTPGVNPADAMDSRRPDQH